MTTAAAGFWEALDELVLRHQLVVDRPAGSAHAGYPDLIYPFDYGYLEGTASSDGDGIDVWIGSQASRNVDAVILTVDMAKHDAEIKLLLGCTVRETQIILNFLTGHGMRPWLVTRQGGIDWLLSRRSVRRFKPDPIADETLQCLIETAAWAPSAHNRQPWRFIVLASLESRQRLAGEMGAKLQADLLKDGLPTEQAHAQMLRSQERILQAPAAILLCQDTLQGDVYPDPPRQQAEFMMGMQSVALAGGYLLLAAHALGLGAVWMCAPLFAQESARHSLNLPSTWAPQALILLGYPSRPSRPRSRLSLSEIARFL